ncbi:RND family transporter [Myxococcota bacterium]
MRDKILSFIIHMALKRRGIVWMVSGVLTLALGAASGNLKFNLRWEALLPETMPVVKEYKKIDDNFLQPGNMIIAISGDDPVELEQVTDEVTAVVEKTLLCPPEVASAECKSKGLLARYVYGGMPEDWLVEHGLRLAKPKDAKRAADQLENPQLLAYLTRLNDDLEAEYTEPDAVADQESRVVQSLNAVQRFAQTLYAASRGPVDDATVRRTVRDLTVGRPYLISLDNSMSLVMVASATEMDDFDAGLALDKKLEELLAPVAEAHAGFTIERTGMIAVGRDEMDSIGPATQALTMLALLAIFVLLVWNYRSVVVPVLALLPIVAGIIWTMGIIALTLSELNMITAMTMVVLLGLGIDFSIHIANRFSEELAIGRSIEESLELAIGHTGVAVVTGAVTTAVAFFTLTVADTKGVSEFGFASGLGVLTTLIAVMWILPALLVGWAARRHKQGKATKPSHDFSTLGHLAVLMGRWRIAVVLVFAALTGAGLYAGSRLSWEYNFLNLEPEGLRSVDLHDEIVDKYRLSISTSMLTASSIEESRTLRTALKKKRIVGEVDDISQWVSRPDLASAEPHIARLRTALTIDRDPLSYDDPGAQGRLAEELDRLWANLVEIQFLAITGGQDRVVEKTQQLVATRETLEKGLLKQLAKRFADPSAVDWTGVGAFAAAFDVNLQAIATRMTQSSEPVTEEMIPPHIRAQYVSQTAPGYLMHIFPKKNLYQREELEAFRAVAEAIHPSVTGTPQMILEMSDQTMKEGRVAVLLALLVILVVLLIDFRRPLIAVLTFLPLFCGVAILLAVMWLLDEKFNYLNMIALPVIIGIGVDDGVHFFHRYTQEGRGRIGEAVTSVGRAMMMSSLTTMIGFGSLMFYLMRGMASMGRVLFIGVGLCFLVTVTLLPALARLLEKRIIRDKEVSQ